MTPLSITEVAAATVAAVMKQPAHMTAVGAMTQLQAAMMMVRMAKVPGKPIAATTVAGGGMCSGPSSLTASHGSQAGEGTAAGSATPTTTFPH